MQAPEPEPEPQGLADESERIPGIVEDMEKEDQDAQIMEQCGGHGFGGMKSSISSSQLTQVGA